MTWSAARWRGPPGGGGGGGDDDRPRPGPGGGGGGTAPGGRGRRDRRHRTTRGRRVAGGSVMRRSGCREPWPAPYAVARAGTTRGGRGPVPRPHYAACSGRTVVLVGRGRHGGRHDLERPGLTQGRGGRLQRGAGRHDVVDDQHPGVGHAAGGPGTPAHRAGPSGPGPVCAGPPSRSSRRRHGTPSWRATCRATSSAWSNPRWCRRRSARRRPGDDVDHLARTGRPG